MTAFIELTLGKDSAVISTTGAALHEYTVGDRPVVVRMSAFDGAVLAPWPNRIADGRYDFDGRTHQLPITEPARNTALHGLAAEADWDLVEREAASVTLRTVISDEEGYPFDIALQVTYSLGPTEAEAATEGAGAGECRCASESKSADESAGADEGKSASESKSADEGRDATERANELRIHAQAHNRGQLPAPFGFGFHPWIHPGADRVDQAQLLVPAETWLEVDDRLIPREARPFDTGSFVPADHEADEASCLLCKDFRALRTLSSARLDDAFGSPQHGVDGWSRVRLKGADDRTVTIGMDHNFRSWQVCTGDELDQGHRRRAIAIEPMTCPPNAFAAGSDYDVIAPQGELSAEWSIALH